MREFEVVRDHEKEIIQSERGVVSWCGCGPRAPAPRSASGWPSPRGPRPSCWSIRLSQPLGDVIPVILGHGGDPSARSCDNVAEISKGCAGALILRRRMGTCPRDIERPPDCARSVRGRHYRSDALTSAIAASPSLTALSADEIRAASLRFCCHPEMSPAAIASNNPRSTLPGS